jgi:hypothetical protein
MGPLASFGPTYHLPRRSGYRGTGSTTRYFPSLARYSCEEGFILRGSATTACHNDGSWLGEPAVCYGCGAGCPVCPALALPAARPDVVSSCAEADYCCAESCVLSCATGYTGTPQVRKTPTLARKLGQPQPFLAVSPPECTGQLVPVGPA